MASSSAKRSEARASQVKRGLVSLAHFAACVALGLLLYVTITHLP